MIRLEKVCVEWDESTILHDIDLVWRPGEAVALIGANGAGKSSLLKVLATLVKPSSGRLTLPEDTGWRGWRQTVGMVFPDTFLYDSLTAMENLEFYRRLYDIRDRSGTERLLEKVGLLSVKNEKAGSFSKGMRQRLSIARALIHHPAYLLLDEPFDGLDLASQEVVRQLLAELHAEGIGWILVSHDVREAWNCCERAVLLDQGRIVLEESCSESAYDAFLNIYRQRAARERDHAAREGEHAVY